MDKINLFNHGPSVIDLNPLFGRKSAVGLPVL
jgi:hypothetical protein